MLNSVINILMLGINIGNRKTEEEINLLKSNFNNLFTNSIMVNSENTDVKKIELSRDLVYTVYNLANEYENYYSVNVQIRTLNTDSNNARIVNAEIKNEFYNQANNIMRRTEGYTIYTVSYAAFVNEDILSIVIKSSLKEQNKSEKVTVKTYNYSIPEEKVLSFNDLLNSSKLLEKKEITETDVQRIIDSDIKTAYNNAKKIAEQFGNLYERDLSNDIYKIENTSTFFLTQDGYVYIVYAYGNNDYTNEMDLIIF